MNRINYLINNINRFQNIIYKLAIIEIISGTSNLDTLLSLQTPKTCQAAGSNPSIPKETDVNSPNNFFPLSMLKATPK